MHEFWVWFIVEGYLLTLLLLPWVVLQTNKPPVSVLAWMMAIIMLPYFGSLLFIVFGINRVERSASRKRAARQHIRLQLPIVAQFQVTPEEELNPTNQRLARLADRVGMSRPCFGNTVEILSDTNKIFGMMELAIADAEHSIHLEHYIWEPDRSGTRMRDLLIEKARSGVRVRFLCDGVGSMLLGRRFLKPMRDAGIEVANTVPGLSFHQRWQINLRNHRKIIVVDGNIGFTGGMNIGDEYLGRVSRLGYWRDTHLRLRGPTVLQLQQVFAEDWYFATNQQLTDRQLFPQPEETGNDVAQIIAGGPDGEVNVFHSLYFAAINEAHERITLATSYFIPTPALVSALEAAAYRGVQVRILIPGRGDHQWMVIAGRGFYESLLQAGVEIYEYEKGVLHSKTLTIDGIWSLVGSPNFDTRSLILNFEVAAILYGARSAGQLEEQFADDLVHSRRIDRAVFRRRGIHRKFAEQTLKLFSPVL
jgi:cardiolipin synthase A/B